MLLGHVDSVSRGVSADMGYARQGLQEWRMGAGWGIVNGGGCEQRVVVTCDIAFVTSPNWDVSKLCCTSSHPLWGSVPLYVYPQETPPSRCAVGRKFFEVLSLQFLLQETKADGNTVRARIFQRMYLVHYYILRFLSE